MQTTATPAAPRLPFDEGLEPFAEEAWKRLSGLTSLPSALLTPAARGQLDRALRAWLAAVSGKVLAHEFALYRLDRRSSFESFLEPSGGTSGDLYRAFVRDLLDGDWEAVRREYREWGRIRDGVIHHWIESTAELLARLARDRDDISRAFAAGRRLGKMASIRPLSDDRHDGGRTILGLRFEDGTRVVYKPRPVGIEAWFGTLLCSLTTETGSLPDLRTPRILDRGAYGWHEFIPFLACASSEGVTRFFQRSGALLAVLHALGAVDCHLENLIAHGEHPVLVDAETVLQPEPRSWREPPESSPPEDRADAAGVVETGFLPHPIRRDGPDTSGLDGGRISMPIEGALVWEGINTDRMALREGTVLSTGADNGVHLGSVRVDPREHEAELMAGFDAMYARLVNLRTDLLASPLWASARKRRIRFLARSTSVYWLLALGSLEPRFLTGGRARRRELERLFAPLDQCADPDRLRPLLEAEVEALTRLDVPVFYVGSDERDLHLPAARIPDFFQESGLERAERRIRALSPEDRVRQGDLIRRSLIPVGGG